MYVYLMLITPNKTVSDDKYHTNALKSTLQDYMKSECGTQVQKLLKVMDEVYKKENIVIFEKLAGRRRDLLRFSTNGNAIDTGTPLRPVSYLL